MKKKSPDFIGRALVLALIIMVISLIGGFAHIALETWFKWIGTIVMLIGIIYFCLQYAKEKTDGVSFGNVFGYGFKIALIISILLAIYTVISFNIIFPESVDQILAKARTDMEASGKTEDQIDQAMAMSKKFMQPGMLSVFAFIGTLFFGTLSALLGAAFAKKSEAIPEVFKDNP
jgi:hypothetical protein